MRWVRSPAVARYSQQHATELVAPRGDLRTIGDGVSVLGTHTVDWFCDDGGSPHETAINRVASVGVAAGTEVGVFRPQAWIGRGQMASFLARLLDVAVEEGRARPPT